MKKEVDTRWYIHPKDAHTNEVLSTALEGLNNAEKFETKECADGKKRQLVEVKDYAFVSRLSRSKKSLCILFEVFRSQGNGKPAPWKFLKRPKPTLERLKKTGAVATVKIPQKRATQF